ncbi:MULTISPECIES: hypothetical protein [unclassified Corynebacterium]|uniref:hypothetical protein n=1 Tax=unclassified Corynebacterium TaxID=2624378 RepID=UPI00128B658C|nr:MULTISPECIES: hypothetical protein [unclassified Corynebacterium]
MMVFIAAGVLAATAIGFLVWRLSTPSSPSTQTRHSAAADATPLDSAEDARAPQRTRIPDAEPAEPRSEAPALPRQAEPTVLRAAPTKIYRPDSVSAPSAVEPAEQEPHAVLALGEATPATDSRPAEEAQTPQTPTPGTIAEPEPRAEDAQPGYLPRLSEALEHTQEELTKIPERLFAPLREEATEEENPEPTETAEPTDAGWEVGSTAPSDPPASGFSEEQATPAEPTSAEPPSTAAPGF